MAPPVRNGFKQTLDGTEGRRLREETTIQLRKNKKEELLRKKRAMMTGNGMMGMTGTNGGGTVNAMTGVVDNNANKMMPIPTTPNEINNEINYCMIVFQKFFHNRNDVTIDELILVAKKLRRMLSVEKNPPVQQVVNSGALFFLIQMLSLTTNEENDNSNKTHDDTATLTTTHSTTNPALLFEATWALTNIASTEHTDKIVNHPGGVIDKLALLLNHDSPQVREQAGWCLGNIAGDKNEYRDMLLRNAQVVAGFIVNLEQPDSVSLLQNICWAVSNLCRGKPQPSLSLVRPFISPLYDVIRQSIDKFNNNDNGDTDNNSLYDMISDAMWCMTYLSDGDNSRIQIVIEDCGNLVQCIKEILKLNKNRDGVVDRGLLIPCIRCLVNFVSGTHEQTSLVVDSGILKYIPALLENSSKALRKEICWMLSNIAAGTEDHIWSIFQAQKQSGLARTLIRMATSAETMSVRKEAIWAICNIVTTCNNQQYRFMIELDVIDPLCEILKFRDDAKLLIVAMDALEVILKKNEETGTCHDQLIEEYEGLDSLENLQDHPSNEVYVKAISLLERYFNGTEDDDDQNLMPSITTTPAAIGSAGASCNGNNTTFEFSAPKQLFPPTNMTLQFGSDRNNANNDNSMMMMTSPLQSSPYHNTN